MNKVLHSAVLYSLLILQDLLGENSAGTSTNHLSNYYNSVLQSLSLKIERESKVFGNNNDIKTCTYMWIGSTEQVDINFEKYIDSVSLITNILDSNMVLKASTSVKYSTSCSIVTYFETVVSKISFEWVYNVFGGFYNSVHILFLKELPPLNSVSLGFRVMFNQVLVLHEYPTDSQCSSVWTIDLFCTKYISTGKVCIDKSSGSSTGPNLQFLPNKWIDFNGAPYLFAMSSQIDAGPKQPQIDDCSKLGYIRYIVKDMDPSFLGNLDMALTMVELAKSINATATRKEFSTQVFVAANISGKMEGLAYEMSIGNAHGCFGLSNDWETSRYLILSNVANVDQFSFFTKIPGKSEGSLLFLFEAYQPIVWLVYSVISSTLMVLLAVINGIRDARIMYAVMKPILEQSLEQSVCQGVLLNYKARLLVTAPFLSSVVAISLFKSYIASLLVKPVMNHPPQTIQELADSDYEIGTFMSESTELGSILQDLKDTALVQKMTPRFIHYDLATGKNCFFKILDGPVACMGMKSLGARAAMQLLTDSNTGHKPFVWAKDFLLSRYSGVGLSKFMPHVKGRINRVLAALTENGVNEAWLKPSLMKFIDKTPKRDNYDTIELKYPLLLHLIGLGGSCFAFLIEIILYIRRRTTVYTVKRESTPSFQFVF